MGGVVQGALGSASNMVGGLPIVGGMARQGIGQAGGMLGMAQQGGQPGGGGLFGGGKGGQQGGPGGMLGGLMGGGKGGQQSPFGGQQGPPGLAQFAQSMMGGTLRGGQQQSPFGGGGTWAERHPGGGTGGYSTQSAPQGGQSPGWGNNFGMGAPQSLAQQRIANRHAQPGYGQPPTAQNAQLSSDFLKPYGM